jgi:hypothetical protein
MITCPPGQHVEEICADDPPVVEPPPLDPQWRDLGVAPAIAASPTAEARQIVQLHPFGGKLWLGYGDFQDTKQPGCDLICYDPTTEVFETLTHIATDALWGLRTLGDELWALVTDPEIGADPDAVIVAADGTFRELRGGLSPYPWHLFDAVEFNGKPYLAGSDRLTSNDAATVWTTGKRADGAKIWPAAFQRPGVYRAYALFVLNGVLWVILSNGTAYTTASGTTWTLASPRFPTLMTKPLPWGDAVVYRSGWPALGPGALASFDGTKQVALGTVQDHFVADGGLWALMSTGAIKREGQDVTTAPPNARSLAVLNDAVYVGTEDSHLWRFSRS